MEGTGVAGNILADVVRNHEVAVRAVIVNAMVTFEP